jgi:pimeloyl-ACP methyl ester carboxylesterase
VRALRISAIALSLLIALGGVVIFAVTRNSPARAALGEPRQAATNDAQIEYFIAGPTPGQSVVLLPSFARSVSDLNELATALHVSGYRTIAVQPRGIDGSTLPSTDITLHTLALDVVAVLDQEGLREPVHVIGHAYGNRIARTLATNHPERVGALVLLAAGGVEPTPADTSRSITCALLRLGCLCDHENATKLAFFASSSSIPDYWLEGWYPLAGISQARAMVNTRPEEWSAGGSAPILALHPVEDAAAPGGAALLQRQHPDRVTLLMVPAAGHALLPEQPDFVAREAVAFFGKMR